MMKSGGSKLIALCLAVMLCCAALVVWKEAAKREVQPSLTQSVQSEAPAPPVIVKRGPENLSPIIDLPGDPVVVDRGAAEKPREFDVELPVKLAGEAAKQKDAAYFVSSPLVSVDGGFMGKMPEAGQQADALGNFLQLGAEELANGGDANIGGAEMDDDGGAATPENEQDLINANAKTNRLELSLDDLSQNKQTVLKAILPAKISDLLISHGYSQESSVAAETAAKALFNHQTLLPRGVAVVVGALDASGSYRVSQLSIYDGQDYVGAVALAENGAYVEAAKPTEPQNLFQGGAAYGMSYTLADGVYSAGLRVGMPESVIREAIAMIGRLADLKTPVTADETMRALYTKASRGGAKIASRVVYIGLSGSSGIFDCYVFEASNGAFTCFDPRGGNAPPTKSHGHSDEGAAGDHGAVIAPVGGAQVTSLFGMRFHPVLHILRLHAGIDFGVPIGSPVRAVASGKVEIAGPVTGFGNHIRIQHQGFETSYSHLEEIPETIKPGVEVRQGDVIARSGNTGLSTGPHLHFEYYLNGAAVDPLPRFAADVQATAQGLGVTWSKRFPSGDPIDEAQLAAFPGFKAQVDAVLAAAGK